MIENEDGGTWSWLGIESFIIDGSGVSDPSIEGVTAYRSSGHQYRQITLEDDGKEDRSVIGDEPDTFQSIGMASVYPDHGSPHDSPGYPIEIYANEDGSRWTALPLQNNVTESSPDDNE